MNAELHDTFTAVLRASRPELNQRFALARRRYPSLTGPAFARFLAETVDPWLRSALASRPECGPDVVLAGYEAGLSLVGERLVGDGAQSPVFGVLLTRLLVGCARLSTFAPRRFLIAAGNALHHLTETPGAYPEFWVSELERFAPYLNDFEQWLRVGQVLAWRSGLAHYRASALRAADLLPLALALPAVGVGAGSSWPEVRAELARDPWFVPGQPASSLRIAGELGAFRGFGGLFWAPPRVLRSGESFLVTSEGDAWWLFADAFGGTLQRASSDELKSAVAQNELPGEVGLAHGQLSFRSQLLRLPSESAVTSFATIGTTFVCSFAASHALAIVALPS